MPSIIRSSRGYGKNKSSSVTDVYAKNTTLLLKSDQATKSVYTDFSSNPAEIITNGNVTSSNFHPYNEGFYSCQFFGGVSDYLTIPNNINLSGDFTVELWFYDLGVSKTLQQFAYSSSSGFGCGINSFDGNSIRKLDWRAVGGTPIYGATGVTPYTWHHAAYVKSGTTFKIFLDGVEDYVNTNYTTTFPSTVTYIGSANNSDALYSFLGMISNFRVVSGKALYSNNFTPPTSPLTPIPGTVILTCQSNRFLDRSVYNPTVTKSGTVEIRQISPFEKGAALTYQPTSHNAFLSSTSLRTTFHPSYIIGKGDFTIEFWFKQTANQSFGTIFNIGQQQTGIMIRARNSTYEVAINNTFVVNASGTIVNNVWQHLALVRNNGVWTLYRNGVSLYTGANTDDIQPSSGINVGQSTHAAGEFFSGYISNLRVVNGICLYTSAFAPSTSPLQYIPGTVFLGFQNSTLIDNSPLNSTITLNTGTVSLGTDSPFYNVSLVDLTGNEGSGWFPTANAAWLTLPSDSTKFRFNTNVDFTIEAWVNPIYQLTNDYGIIDARTGAASNSAWLFGLTTVGGVYKIYFFNTGANAQTGSITIPLDAWTHVAVSRVGTNLRLYVNGVLDLTATSYGGDINPGLASARIGHKDFGSTTFATNGRISNLRVVNGTGIYTNSFVPPTAPLEPVANTVLLLLQSSTPINNNTMVDDSFVTESIFNFNNVAKNIANPFGNNWSYYFNGTASDYLSVAHSPSLDLSTNSPDFTVECWFNCTTFTTGNQWLFNKDGVASTSYAQYGISISSTGLLRGLIGTGDGAGGGKNNTFYGSQQIQINRWYHVAMVKTGGVLKFFVDGRLNTSLVPLQTMIDGGRPLLIGWQQDQPDNEAFNGYISNLRIVKDVALYQDTFTPPARALTASPVPAVYYPESFGTTFTGTSSVSYDRNSYLTTGAHTVEAWIYPTAFPSSSTIVSNYRWQIGQNAGWNFRLNSTGQLEMVASIGTFNVQPIIYKSTTSVKLNSWSHVACTRDSANTMRIFINGNYANAEATYSASFDLTSDGGVPQATRVGGTVYDGNPGEAFGGTISAVRIVTGGNDSCLYANSFIPQYPLLPVVNTVLLISASNTYVNLANTLLVGTTTGSPVIANTRPFLAVANTRPVLLTAVSNKIEDKSINRLPITKFRKVSLNKYSPFDSSIVTPKSYSVALERQNQYVNIPTQDWTRLVGEFTIEGWFYWNYTAVAGGVCGVNSNNGFLMYHDGTYLAPAEYNVGNSINTTFKPQVGIWYHIAVTRDNLNRMTMWVNGESTGTGIVSTTYARGVFTIGTLNSNGNQMRGYISNFRVVSNRCLYTKNFKVPEAPLEAVQGTVLLTCQSPTFIDNSTTNSPLQVAGNPDVKITDFNPFGDNYTTKPALYESSVFDGSAYYDGLGDYTIVQDFQSAPNYPLRLGNIFTIQGWFNATSEIAANIAIVSKGSAAANGWQLMMGRGNVLHFSNATQVLSTSTPIKFNEWNHFAVVRNIGNRTMVFVNGNLESTGIVTNPYTESSSMSIGGGRVPGANVFTGYISGLRIDRNALYSNNFVPPYSPITSIKDAAYIQDTRVATIDYSMNESMGRAGDVKTIPITPFAPDGTYSVYFDGAGDFFTLPSSLSYSFGTADFTIEMWVNVTSLAATRTFYDTMNSGDGTGTGRFAMQLSTGGTVQIFTGAGSIFTSGGTLLAGSWYHIAYVKNANTGKLYVNGTQVNSTYTDNNNYVVGTNKRPIIGINGFDDSSNPMFGYISNLRVVKGVAVYTGNFTPPSEPLEKTQNGSVNIAPLASTSGGSIYFDGTGDYLTIANSGQFQFPGDFTIEGWMYFTNIAGGSPQVLFGVRSGGTEFDIRWFTTRWQISLNAGSGSDMGTTPAPVNNSWTHVAAVRSGSSIRLYINGVQTETTLTNSSTLGQAAGVAAGSVGGSNGGSNTFTGYISNLRVVRGRAIYTSNFSVPTAPLSINQPDDVSLLTAQGIPISDTSPYAGIITQVGGVSAKNTISPFSTYNVVLLTARDKAWGDFSDDRSNLAITGGAAIKNFNPFGIVTNNNSTFFDGSGDYLSIRPNSQVFNFGTGDFTFETWMYPMSTSINEYTLLGSEVTNAFSVSRRNAGESFAYRGFANTYTNFITSGVLNSYSNSWVHIAISRANSISRAYVNGIKVASNLNLTNYISSNLPTTIGANINGAQAYTGALADLRVTKGIARYTGDLFTPPGTLPYKSTVTKPSLPLQYDVLLVAGGGAGGFAYGGGGGAGGLIATNVNILSGVQYSIIVGGGGGTSTAPSTTGTYNGSNTSAFGLTAVGGGQGGPDTGKLPSPGGSGGGAALNTYLQYNAAASTGNAYPGQGFTGGIDIFSDSVARSGGGAGGPGGVTAGGAGGVGYKWLDGNYYAGGGGGMHPTTRTSGGFGGGGYGAVGSTVGTAGAVNTGGGGGGGAQPGGVSTYGQGGGSGVAIIRYPKKYPLLAYTSANVDISEIGDYRYYSIKQSANIVFDVSSVSFISAFGGAITSTETDRIHTFTSPGRFTVVSSNPKTTVSVLVVGGGGGGGGTGGGGGGGGAVVESRFTGLRPGSYNITVGRGGAGGSGAFDNNYGSNGGTSFANITTNSIVAFGGGGGGYYGPPGFNGRSGAGGGGAGSGGSGQGASGAAGFAGYGSAGGNNFAQDGVGSAGGGGGAGGVGWAAGPNAGGRGGYGANSSISGSMLSYGAGGNGVAGNGSANTSVMGIGGIAATASANATPGVNYTGSGGGGGYGGVNIVGGDGGSGVVVIRYSTDLSVPPPVESQGDVLFTSSGTWRAPATTASVNMVLVGGGGGGGQGGIGSGGGGAGLIWVNNVPVSPNVTYNIVIGAGGSAVQAANGTSGASTWFSASDYIAASGGGRGFGDATGRTLLKGIGGSFINNSGSANYGGGSGGNSGGNALWPNANFTGGGGGGAGGYSGNGGLGTDLIYPGGFTINATAGAGGGGGGGGAVTTNGRAGFGGGGVGVYGQGSNGLAANAVNLFGWGGSGGEPGFNRTPATDPGIASPGGLYGGGGGGGTTNGPSYIAGNGGRGALRIVWGQGNTFP